MKPVEINFDRLKKLNPAMQSISSIGSAYGFVYDHIDRQLTEMGKYTDLNNEKAKEVVLVMDPGAQSPTEENDLQD